MSGTPSSAQGKQASLDAETGQTPEVSLGCDSFPSFVPALSARPGVNYPAPQSWTTSATQQHWPASWRCSVAASARDREREETPLPETPMGEAFSEDHPGSVVEEGPKRREYHLDWLRVVAIYLGFFFHCVEYLEDMKLWPHPHERRSIVAFQCVFLQVGKPLFFHVAGRAQALTPPLQLRKTLVFQCQRLLLPFLICYVILIPPWQFAYYAVAYPEEWSPTLNPGIPDNFVRWVGWYFRNHFKFEVGWLWFLLALFMAGAINAPLYHYAEFRKRKYALLTLLVWSVLLVIVLLLRFSFWVFFCAVLGPAIQMAAVTVVPFPEPRDRSWNAARWLAIVAVTGSQVIAHMGLVCSFRYSDVRHGAFPSAKVVPGLLVLLNMHSQGYFVQRWGVDEDAPPAGDEASAPATELAPLEQLRAARLLSPRHEAGEQAQEMRPLGHRLRVWARLSRSLLGGVLILVIALGSPVGEFEEFWFPIYSASFLDTPYFAAMHVAAAWAYIGVIEPWFKARVDDDFHPDVFRHATSSLMVTYVFHPLFIVWFAYWGLKPQAALMQGAWKLLNPVVTFLVATAGCQAVYFSLLRVPVLGALFGLHTTEITLG